MNIDLDQLVTFERIVREGSFSAAAWALDIPQPTVSARIKTLEQTLGGSLFHRRGRQVTLTDLGQTFLPYVRRTIDILTEGIEMARQVKATWRVWRYRRQCPGRHGGRASNSSLGAGTILQTQSIQGRCRTFERSSQMGASLPAPAASLAR